MTVNVHHIREVGAPKEPPPAGPYVLSSPGRMGKLGGMRRFRRRWSFPQACRTPSLTAELAAQPDKKTGQVAH